uniref:F-box only protein 30 n=1 Tax=Parascaris univalens TaxID=6257 RepID=A0A915A740_PARUN
FMEYEECSLDIDDHIHCRYCYKIGCNYSKCKMIICTECSIPLHPCKLDDHLLLCSKARVPCPNASGGCPLVLRRERIGAHLESCCASVVFCAVQWNRRILSSFAKRKMKRIAKGLQTVDTRCRTDPAEIDVNAAIVDQEMLLESYRISRNERKRLSDFWNPFHPLMPLRVPLEPQRAFNDDDSSDEENLMKEKLRKKRKSPFENCYLCKIDPASQHLHTLGNFIEQNDENVDVKVPAIKISLIPAFYEQRKLYIDIVREHLSSFVRKAENLSCYRIGVTVYTFHCNENFRRNEYSEHYKLCHMEADEYIGRCPMYIDGCPFFYFKKSPKWGSLSQYLSCVVHCPPEMFSVIPYAGKALSELPEDVLHEILQYLDSGSLRCLAATNHRLRNLCFKNFASSAMVHIKWTKSETGNWSEKCFVWEFSKSQRKIDEWNNESTLPLTNHLHECEFNIIKKYDAEKIALPYCIAQD